MSGIDSLTSRLSEYIDIHLQPLVRNMHAFLKDTKHTLQLLKKRTTSDDLVKATGDVASLYTNIDHQGAMRADKWALKNNCDMRKNQRRFILKCLNFCLEHNLFWYQNTFHLQIKGVAMGAKFAPSVANLYMAKWKVEGVLCNRDPNIMLYRRFIDDLLIIWKRSEDSLEILLQTMNDDDQNINLTWVISKDMIHFLDLEIRNTSQGIETRTHFKATDCNSYIPTMSCHFRP